MGSHAGFRAVGGRSGPGVWRVLARLVVAVVALGGGVLAPAQPEGAGQAAGQPGAPTGAVPSHRQADNVAIITIEGEINKITSYSFQRRLAMAEAGGADAIVVDLDTPGGEVGAVLEICDAIRNSPISNSVAWVNPQAYSGGAIIALACKEIVTTRSVHMGDALPIRPDLIARFMSMEQAERQKITAPLIAEVVGSARLRGWDEFVVQGFVALGVELWWVTDTQTGRGMAINEAEYRMLFDGVPLRTGAMLAATPLSGGGAAGAGGDAAPEPAAGHDDEGAYRPAGPALDALNVDSTQIGRLSQRPVITGADKGRYKLVGYLTSGDGPITLNADELALLGFAANVDAVGAIAPILTDADLQAFLGAKNLRRIEPSWSETFVALSTSMVVRGLLITVFLVMLFLEMSHPGVGVPGAIALVALVGLLAPPALIGMASWWEIGAIVLGILLILTEVFILPGFGIPGVVGLLLLFGGMLGTFVGETGGLFPDSPTEQDNLLFGLLTMVLSLVTTVVVMYYLGKHFSSLPILGRLILSDENDGAEGLLASIPVGDAHLPAVGEVGRAITPLRPSGRGQFGDRMVDIVCDLGYVDAGSAVRVVAADRFRVVVEAVASA
jgi:membrane-bound serine protease (ClpP class)